VAISPAAEAIKQWRRSRLWSVRRLARESDLSPALVSQIENGKRPLTVRAAAKIAHALAVPPHELLGEAGLIPREKMLEARGMGQRATQVPEMVAQARCPKNYEALKDWFTADYLRLLGEDAYGNGYDDGPGGHWADWRFVDPTLPESRLRLEPDDLLVERARPPIQPTGPARSPIEGWDNLSPADQQFIQQMVNKLRRSTSGEQ
jgi:transcriptional regulator with XRE-family HTH domain